MKNGSLSILGAVLLTACTATESYRCKPEFADDCESLRALKEDITASTALPRDPETICRVADETIEKVFSVFTSHPWREAEDNRRNIVAEDFVYTELSRIFMPGYPGYDDIRGMQCYYLEHPAFPDEKGVGCRLDSGSTGYVPDISFVARTGPTHLQFPPYYEPSITVGICSQNPPEAGRSPPSEDAQCGDIFARLGSEDLNNSGPGSATILHDLNNPTTRTECPDILMDEIEERIRAVFNFVHGKLGGR